MRIIKMVSRKRCHNFLCFSIYSLILLIRIVEARSNGEKANLIMAQTLCRHGARNIFDDGYQNDPFRSPEYWRGGYGELINLGKQQEYALGQYLRERYSSLIGNDEYSANNVYVQTTDKNRVIMSAQAAMAGMFPPHGNQKWNPYINWQPIPIHSSEDHLLTMTACDRFDYDMVKYIKTTEYRKLFTERELFVKYLEKKSGSKLDTLTQINEKLYDPLFEELRRGYRVPQWAKAAMKSGGDLEYLARRYFALSTRTTEMKKLWVGYLLEDILDRFKNKTDSLLMPDRNLRIYFAHDTNLANLLNGLGVSELQLPPYASCIFFELYKTDTDNYVQMFYRNSTDTEPPALNIPYCGIKCPLDKWYELYENVMPTQSFIEECKLREGEILPPGGNPEYITSINKPQNV